MFQPLTNKRDHSHMSPVIPVGMGIDYRAPRHTMNQSLIRTTSNTPSLSLRQCLNLVLAMLLTLALAGCIKQEPFPEGVRDLTLKTLSGEQIKLAELNRPILVNFWATDCGVCIRKMPDLASLYEQYAPEGFELVAVALPYDPPNLVLEMAERGQWPFPVALDVTGEVLHTFPNVKVTPTSFLIDKDGQLVKRYVGAIPIKKLERRVKSLLDLG